MALTKLDPNVIGQDSTGAGKITSAGGSVSIDSSGNVRIANTTANSVLFAANGRMSIGTSSAWSDLTLYGTGDKFVSVTSPSGSATKVGIDFNPSMNVSDIASNQPQARIYSVDNNYGASITLASKTQGSLGNSLVDRLTLAANGNVGFGTSTPSNLIEIVRTSNTSRPVFAVSNTGIIFGGSSGSSDFFNVSRVHNRWYTATTSGACWLRIAFVPGRVPIRVVCNTTGNYYSPGATIFHIFRDWGTDGTFVGGTIKLGTQYVTKVRMQSTVSGGDYYIEVYFDSVTSNQLQCLQYSVEVMGDKIGLGDSTTLGDYGTNASNLTYTGATIIL